MLHEGGQMDGVSPPLAAERRERVTDMDFSA